jgi:HSP20 family protein
MGDADLKKDPSSVDKGDKKGKKENKGKKGSSAAAKPAAIVKELSPVTDLRQTDDRFFVAVEMPGLSRRDVTIKMNINEMVIRGRKRRMKGLKKENEAIHEIENGLYVRTINLPETVQPKKARTTMRNGILKIVMPKKDYTKKVRISVK